MPTPVQHLALARDLAASNLPPAVRYPLEAHWGAHLLGHIAPDASACAARDTSWPRREATHFFTLPPGDQPPAHAQLFAAYPALARASALRREQAVFVAGYIAHLWLDELWIRQIFTPYFDQAAWGTFRERLLLHNVLRAWLDRRAASGLAGDESEWLRGVAPDHWLPFLDDGVLRAWRDEIAGQLRPGAALRTAQVFAARTGVSPDEFNRLLSESGELERRVFARAPQEHIARFNTLAVSSACELVVAYMEDQLCT